jgi:hypothetical protein
MSVCSLESNRDLKIALDELVNSLINEYSKNETFNPEGIPKVIFDKLKEPLGVDKALGIVYHTPRLIFDIINDNPEYKLEEFINKGYDSTKFFRDVVKPLETAENKIEAIANRVGLSNISAEETEIIISNQPSSSKITVKASIDSKMRVDRRNAASIVNSTTQETAKEVYDVKAKKYVAIKNETNKDSLFHQTILNSLLAAKKNDDPDFTNVKYGNHTGFRLLAMLERDLATEGKVRENRSSQLKNRIAVTVITDNDGSILYFNEDGTVDKSKTTGRPVYFFLRNPKDAVKMQSLKDSAIFDAFTRGEEFNEEEFEQAKKDLAELIEDVTARESGQDDDRIQVLLDIIGGTRGVYTDTDTLSKEEKKEVEQTLDKFNLSKKEIKNIKNVDVERIIRGKEVVLSMPAILFDNADSWISLKTVQPIGEQDPELLNHLIDVLTEEITTSKGVMTPAQKIAYINTFINPNVLAEEAIAKDGKVIREAIAGYTIGDTLGIKPQIIINLGGVNLDLSNKEKSKEQLKDFLGKNARIRFHVKSHETNSYQYLNLVKTPAGFDATEESLDYWKFISPKVTPRVIMDKTNNRPMIINGYFSYERVQDEEDIKKEVAETTKKVKENNIPLTKEEQDFGFDKMLRSKLLASTATEQQKSAAQKWWEESGLANALDADGNPLFSFHPLFNTVNSDAWAEFSRSAITLYKGSDYTHAYHEAWHAFSQVYLTYNERTKLYEGVNKLPGTFEVVKKIGTPDGTNYEVVTIPFNTATRQEAEEFIAEQFRIYAMNGGKFKVKNESTNFLAKIFNKIWKALKALIGGSTDINVYSNPGSQGFLSEMFDALYIAKGKDGLNKFTPNLDNAEFGTLNSGVLNEQGETVLTLSESLLLSRTIDGLISDFTTKYVQAGNLSAVSMILSTAENRAKLYAMALFRLNKRRDELLPESKRLEEEIDELNAIKAGLEKQDTDKEDIDKVSDKIFKLSTEKVLLDNNIKLLTTATKPEVFGDIKSMVEGKDTISSVVAFHNANSSFKSVFSEIRKEDLTDDPMEWDETDESTEGTLGAINDTPANGKASEELADNAVIYLVQSLTKQNKETGEPELNELGFAEPIDFKPFWRLLMAKASGETSIMGLYIKLAEAGRKVHPLFNQLISKISKKVDGDLNNTAYSELASMFAQGTPVGDLWLKLLQSLNLHRTDLVTTQVKENAETGEIEIKVGKTTSEHLSIINKDWPTKFQQQPFSQYIKRSNDGVNYINIKNVAERFINQKVNRKGEVTYVVNEEDYIPFLNSIGLYITNNSDIRDALAMSNDVKYIAEVIGKKAASEKDKSVNLLKDGISNISYFLKSPHTVEIDGKSVEIPAANTALDNIGILEAAYSEAYTTGMKFTATKDLKSTHSLNSTATQKVKGFNKAQQKGDFYINYKNSERTDIPEFMHMNYLNPRSNPMGAALITMNSMFNNVDGSKIGDNSLQLYDLSGTSFSAKNQVSRGVVYSKMSPIDKAFTSIIATLGAGFMEGITPGDKQTYLCMKLDKIVTYSLKKTSYLYVDTHSFLRNKDGGYYMGYDPMQEVLQMLYPKLEAEIKRIAMIKADPEFYSKREGFANADKFDIFDEILDSKKEGSKIKDQLSSQEFFDKLDKAGNLNKLLLQDKVLKAKIDAEILEYFDALEARYYKNIFSKVFGNTQVLPEAIQNIILKDVENKDDLGEVEYTTPEGSVASGIDANIMKAAIRSYMINNFIHKTETTAILHTDAFQFNHEKDELVKRVPGVQSGGRVFPTDSLTQIIINSKGRRLYEESLLNKPASEGGIVRKEGLSPEIRSYDGIYNTAVIKESNISSAYIEMYDELFRRDLKSKGYTDETEIAKYLYGVNENGQVGNANKDKEGNYTNIYKGGKLQPFTDIKDGDGQGWITFDSYRILKMAEGMWGPRQEEAYSRIVKGESLSAFELAEIFPVYKLQYYGPLVVEEGRYPVEAFHKFSLFPLVPSVIKGMPAEEMHKAMIAQNIDYATFPSGSKKSFIKPSATQKGDAIYEGDTSNIKPYNQIELTPNPIYVSYLKNQTDVSSKFKNASTFSTQLRKLIAGGLYEFGVPVDYIKANNFKTPEEAIEAWSKVKNKTQASKFHRLAEKFANSLSRLVEYKKQELLDQLKHIENLDGTVEGDTEKMIGFLIKELKEQGFSDHELSIFKADNPEKIDLSISPLAARFERLIMSVVNNRLVRVKLNGEPLVQLSSAFMQKFRKPTKAELRDHGAFGSNGLRSYVTDPEKNTQGFMFKRALNKMDQRLFKTSYFVLDNKTGKYVKKGKIAVYSNVLDENGEVVVDQKTGKPKQKLNFEASFNRLNDMLKLDEWRNDDENYKKLRLTGVRIPVQGDNSIEFGEVAEFLKPDAGTVIIIPAEIVAKSGGDFDVDKLTTYLPYITKNGSLLKDIPQKELDAKIAELEPQFDKLKNSAEGIALFKDKRTSAKAFIKFSIDEFRKNFEKDAASQNISEKKLRNFTGSTDEELLELLEDPKQEEFIKKNFKRAYKVYEKKIKGTTLEELRTIEDALDKLYEETSDFGRIARELADAKEHKQNYESGITNQLIEDMISIMELPEKAASLMTPNDTNIIKPLAEELEKALSKADNLTDFTKAIKTGTKLRKKGISSTNSYTEDFNLKKQQENIASKGSLGIAAVDNYINILLNQAGTTMHKNVNITATVMNSREDLNSPTGIRTWQEKKSKKVDITLKLQHNTIDGKISLSHLLDANKTNSIAEIISQFINGFVDAGRDAFVVYLQGNQNVVPKILFLVEAGVPIEQIADFVSNPMTREYIKIKNARTSILSPLLYGTDHLSDSTSAEADAREDILSGIYLPEDAQLNMTKDNYNLFGLSTALEYYSKPSYFSQVGLKNVAHSTLNNTDDAQIAGFLQYLYVEKLIEDYNKAKQVLNPDTKPSTDLHAAETSIRNVSETMDTKTLESTLSQFAQERSVIAPFFIQAFARNLFGKLFKLRSNKHVTKFLLDKTDKKITSAKDRLNLKKTGYDEETYIVKFKNFIAQYIFANELKQWDVKEGELLKKEAFTPQSKVYKGVPISNEFFNQVNEDWENGLWKIGNTRNNAYIYRKTSSGANLAPVNPDAFKTPDTKEAFIEFCLEREYLRRQAAHKLEAVINTKEFELRKRRLINTGAVTYAKLYGETEERYNERINPVVYEDYLMNKALTNTYNIWQLFRSGDNTIATELMDIIDNYPELSQKSEFDILKRLTSIPLLNDDQFKGLLNFGLKNYTELDEGMIGNYNKQWGRLIKKDFDIVGSEDQVTKASAYISDFFTKLPIYAFLQAGMSSGEFSLASVMPYDIYQKIMEKASQKFSEKLDKEDPTKTLEGLKRLFEVENQIMEENLGGLRYYVLRNRGGMNIRRNPSTLFESLNSLYDKPYLRQDEKRPGIFILDRNYFELGENKVVNIQDIKALKAANPDAIFLTHPRDLLDYSKKGSKQYLTPQDVKLAKTDITVAINAIKSSTEKLLVVYPEGFTIDGVPIRLEADDFEVKGIEISSKSRGLGAALTNPTELAKRNGNIDNSYPIEYKGVVYPDVEAAYQTLKDPSETFTKPLQKDSKNFKLMANLITKKLQTYPFLTEDITNEGGLKFIKASTHNPTKKKSVWETSGSNWFIDALALAYSYVTTPKEETSENIETLGTIQLELIEDLVQQGKAKTTVRKYDKPSGIYKTSGGNYVTLKNMGLVKKLGTDIISTKGFDVSYTLDEFGEAEGFDNWQNFKSQAKYAGKDLIEGKSVYLYEIAPYQPATKVTKVGFDIKGIALNNKDPKKAAIATDMIAFGRDTPTRESSTKKYAKAAKEQGIPVNSGKYNSNTVAFVSVSGNNAATPIDIQNTINEIIKVLNAGGSFIMDNYKNRYSNWNKSGEGVVFDELLTKDTYNISTDDLDNISNDPDYIQLKLNKPVKITIPETIQEEEESTSQSTNKIKTISDDYGVVQVETNPTKQKTEEFLDLIRPQIKAQTYKENIGQNANQMFHFGKMWSRVNIKARPLTIDSYAPTKDRDKLIAAGQNAKGNDLGVSQYTYAYHELDQNGNPLPQLNQLQPIIDEIQKSLGIDMSGYDSVIGNIYQPDEFIYPHKDTTESKSAEGYPVIVYTLGAKAGLGIVDNNKGKMTFANQYDANYLRGKEKLSGYTNEVLTKNGTIYTFGLNGKGRFNLTHSTPINDNKSDSQPPITLPNGDVIRNYTITLTFRRAADLTADMPKTPAKLSTQPSTTTRKTYSGKVTSLQPNQIFVFGSNPLGINGNPAKGTGGAALVAYNIAGVKQGEKMDNKLSDSGKAWGITTVTGPGKKRSKTPQEITEGIKKLYEFAKQNPTKEFLVSDYSATNLNGYTGQEMADMFNAAGPIPSNIVFNENFDKLLSTTQSQAPQTIEPGRYVKYKGQIFIVTEMKEGNLVQIYNPNLEGAKAKRQVSKENIEPMDKKAAMVTYKEVPYMVTPKGTIVSLVTNKAMRWGDENGDRKAILILAQMENMDIPLPERKDEISDELLVYLSEQMKKNFGITIPIKDPDMFNIISTRNIISQNDIDENQTNCLG